MERISAAWEMLLLVVFRLKSYLNVLKNNCVLQEVCREYKPRPEDDPIFTISVYCVVHWLIFGLVGVKMKAGEYIWWIVGSFLFPFTLFLGGSSCIAPRISMISLFRFWWMNILVITHKRRVYCVGLVKYLIWNQRSSPIKNRND